MDWVGHGGSGVIRSGAGSGGVGAELDELLHGRVVPDEVYGPFATPPGFPGGDAAAELGVLGGLTPDALLEVGDLAVSRGEVVVLDGGSSGTTSLLPLVEGLPDRAEHLWDRPRDHDDDAHDDRGVDDHGRVRQVLGCHCGGLQPVGIARMMCRLVISHIGPADRRPSAHGWSPYSTVKPTASAR